jgi:hypothetical protein
MLEYITYFKASTISLSLWLRPQNMLYTLTPGMRIKLVSEASTTLVSEANVTKGHGFESQPPLI